VGEGGVIGGWAHGPEGCGGAMAPRPWPLGGGELLLAEEVEHLLDEVPERPHDVVPRGRGRRRIAGEWGARGLGVCDRVPSTP